MTVASSINKVTYTGNGVSTVFDVPFRIFQTSDLVVSLTDRANGTETVLAGGYTVTGAGQQGGGAVTYPLSGAPLAQTHTLTIRRVLPQVQETAITNQGGYFPSVHETVFDRLTMIDQQQQEQIDRAIKAPPSEDGAAGLVLPPASVRAGKSVKFDDAGSLVLTRFDPDTLQSAAASSALAAAAQATAAAGSAIQADLSHTGAEAAKAQAIASAATAAAVAASIGQETVEQVTENRTASLADNGRVFAVDASAGPIVITLPAIADVGEPFRLTVKKADKTLHAVTVVAFGADTLDGGGGPLVLTGPDAGVRVSSDLDPTPDNWISQSFGLAVGDATPIGSELHFSGVTPPPGWLVENGAVVSRAIYPGLWAHAQVSGMLMSESVWQASPSNHGNFSDGDGATTFRLPDLTPGDRLPIIKAFQLPVDPRGLDIAALASSMTYQTLGTFTPNGVAAAEIPLPTGYRRYHIQIDELYGSVPDALLYLRLSNDGGATFVSTGYAYQRTGVHENAVFNEGRRNLDAAPGILISAYLGTARNNAVSGAITVVADPFKALCEHRTQHERATGWLHMSTGAGWINLPGVNAARLYLGAGTLTGRITVKGER